MSRRLLQGVVALVAVACGLGGGILLLFGLAGLPRLGLEALGSAEGVAGLDGLVRALGGVWLMLGLMFLYHAISIEKNSVWFRYCCVGLLAMGVGPFLSMSSTEPGGLPWTYAVLALVLSPALIAWQTRVAKRSTRTWCV